MNTQPTIAISSCLFDVKCRYNGQGSRDAYTMQTLTKHMNIVHYCPEAPVFGTPRPTIRLVEDDSQLSVRLTTTGENVTSKLVQSSINIVTKMKSQPFSRFIFKSKSPSCGMDKVKVYDANSNYNQNSGVGIFAAQVKKEFPYLPIEEEGRLRDKWLKENFIMRVFAYQDMQHFITSHPTMGDLVAFHTHYKYLLYAKDYHKFVSLGRLVANHEKFDIQEILPEYYHQFLTILCTKSTINKNYNILLHLFGYMKHYFSSKEKQQVLMVLNEFKERIVPMITAIKVLQIYINKFNIEHLRTQQFLSPYPEELALRSYIETYK